MTRSAARELAILLSASLSFAPEDAETAVELFFEREHYATLASEGPQFAEYPDTSQLDYIRTLAAMTVARREELDSRIDRWSHGWRASRLSCTTAAILRCAICEILYLADVPVRSAINEAVELAKKYEGAESAAFVNGVLGGFVRGEQIPEDKPSSGFPEEVVGAERAAPASEHMETELTQ